MTPVPRSPFPVPQDTIPTLTLAEALDRAVKLNPDYVRALGSVSEADWARKAARVAFFVPTLSVSIDYSKYSQAFFNIGTFQQSTTSSTFSLDAQYEVFSLRKFTELGRTQAELESATATEVQRRFAAALLTESAYYSVLADEELARVARGRAERAEEQFRLARARVASGAAVQSDSLTVRLELLRAQVDRLRQESALRVSRLELGRRVGLDGPAAAAALPEEPPPELPISLGDAIAQALQQGPEYRAARARERSAERQLSGRRGGYFPTLTLSAAHRRFDEKLFPSASTFNSLTVRLELLRAQVDRLRQESALRVSRLELGRRVGLDGPAAAAALPEEPPPELPISLGDAIAQALEQGPEYRAARARERSAERQLSGRRGAYFPTLTLSAAHRRFDEKLFPSASTFNSLTLTLSLPVWDNGIRELGIIRARSDRDVARAVRADLERAALRDVTEAYDSYETARAAVTLALEGVAVARENYRVQEARYRAGATTVLDLLTAQNGLSDAEAGLVQARFVARLARARLEAILGTRLPITNGGSQ